jgi:subtilisin family serine protease
MPTTGLRLLAAVCAALMSVATALPAGAQDRTDRDHPRPDRGPSRFVPGEVVLLLEDRVPDPTLRSLADSGEVVPGRSPRLRVVKVAQGAEQQIAARLAQLPGVRAAEPNVRYFLTGSPNDPLYPSQWNMHAIGLDQARELSTGSGVIIAVIDSGVAYASCSGSECDGGAGQALDLNCHEANAPFDFAQNDSFPDDENGHGTAVATIAMACTDEDYGMAGVAPQAGLMPLKACLPDGCSAAHVADAILWATDHGAEVINLSMGGEYSRIVDLAVLYAVEAEVVLVASSGNEGAGSLACPACLPEVISVGASLRQGEVAAYSNGGEGLFGQRLDLVAPGGEGSDGVLAETYQDYCQNKSAVNRFVFTHCQQLAGTSFSAPHVTGVAALVRARHPQLHPQVVRQALRRGALDGGAPGWDPRFGYGRLWAPGALEQAARLALPDQVGVQDPLNGVWAHRHPDGSTSSFYFGIPQDMPVTCDWIGDGIDTPGLYRRTDGFLYLRNSNTQGVADISIFYGIPEDRPVCGDWEGDGVETIGIYRPSEARFYLRNSNTQGVADFSFFFGDPGDLPFAGDWDGDGIDTVGLWRPTTGRVYITNTNATKAADFDAFYGNPGDRFVVGDWDGDGRDSFGIFRPSEQTFYLSNRVGQALADQTILFGPVSSNPVAGVWR